MNKNTQEWIDDLSLNDVGFAVEWVHARYSEKIFQIDEAQKYIVSQKDTRIPVTFELGQELRTALAHICRDNDMEEQLRKAINEKKSLETIVIADVVGAAGIAIGLAGIFATFVAAKLFSPTEKSHDDQQGDLLKSIIERLDRIEDDIKKIEKR